VQLSSDGSLSIAPRFTLKSIEYFLSMSICCSSQIS
jgi:hypothetical protein